MDEQCGSLHKKLTALLNCASAENGSNTPDFILATYLLGCLQQFEQAVNARHKWHKQRFVTSSEMEKIRRWQPTIYIDQDEEEHGDEAISLIRTMRDDCKSGAFEHLREFMPEMDQLLAKIDGDDG